MKQASLTLLFLFACLTGCLFKKAPPIKYDLPEAPSGDATGLQEYDQEQPVFQKTEDGNFIRVQIPEADDKLESWGVKLLLVGGPLFVIGLAASAFWGNALAQKLGEAAGFVGAGLTATGLYYLALGKWLNWILYAAGVALLALAIAGVLYAIRNKSIINLFRGWKRGKAE